MTWLSTSGILVALAVVLLLWFIPRSLRRAPVTENETAIFSAERTAEDILTTSAIVLREVSSPAQNEHALPESDSSSPLNLASVRGTSEVNSPMTGTLETVPVSDSREPAHRDFSTTYLPQGQSWRLDRLVILAVGLLGALVAVIGALIVLFAGGSWFWPIAGALVAATVGGGLHYMAQQEQKKSVSDAPTESAVQDAAASGHAAPRRQVRVLSEPAAGKPAPSGHEPTPVQEAVHEESALSVPVASRAEPVAPAQPAQPVRESVRFEAHREPVLFDQFELPASAPADIVAPSEAVVIEAADPVVESAPLAPELAISEPEAFEPIVFEQPAPSNPELSAPALIEPAQPVSAQPESIQPEPLVPELPAEVIDTFFESEPSPRVAIRDGVAVLESEYESSRPVPAPSPSRPISAAVAVTPTPEQVQKFSADMPVPVDIEDDFADLDLAGFDSSQELSNIPASSSAPVQKLPRVPGTGASFEAVSNTWDPIKLPTPIYNLPKKD